MEVIVTQDQIQEITEGPDAGKFKITGLPDAPKSTTGGTSTAPTGVDVFSDAQAARVEADARANAPGESRQFGFYADANGRFAVAAINTVSPAPNWLYVTALREVTTAEQDADRARDPLAAERERLERESQHRPGRG